MEAKSVFYAAVGAPVALARKVGDRMETVKGKIAEERTSYTKAAEEAINGWAAEGEKVVTRLSEGKVVEEISSKVDLDQAKEQVGKLRDQLEDMLSTWRHSFRPDQADEQPTEEKPAATKAPAQKAPAEKPAAKKSPAKKTSAKPATKTSAAKTTKSTSTAKESTEKSTTTKAKSTS